MKEVILHDLGKLKYKLDTSSTFNKIWPTVGRSTGHSSQSERRGSFLLDDCPTAPIVGRRSADDCPIAGPFKDTSKISI